MKYVVVTFLAMFPFLVNNAEAQSSSNNGVTSFQQDRDSWRRQTAKEPQILQTIYDSIGSLGIKNITDSEQVYCYVVEAAAPNYEGYTLNGMAVRSFCGSLDQELKRMFVGSFLSNEEIVSSKIEQCAIRPRLMFRFIRGIDYTDILLSAPCYSVTIFYGGKYKTYNLSKGAATVNQVVEAFSSPDTSIAFVSPALLDQIVPIGVVQTDEQKNKIKQSKASSETSGPKRDWETKEVEEPAAKKGGWNNLNI